MTFKSIPEYLINEKPYIGQEYLNNPIYIELKNQLEQFKPYTDQEKETLFVVWLEANDRNWPLHKMMKVYILRIKSMRNIL